MHGISQRRAGVLAAAALALAFLGQAGSASARGGTHGVSIATWDASASTIAFGYLNGFLLPDGGHLRAASYLVSFSATSGKLSSQFGLDYLNYAPDSKSDSTHGVGGSAVAMWALPATGRYDNGLPKVSFNIFLGASPAAYISGQENYVTIPFVLGLGLPMSPARWVSIVPWVELAPSLNLDTKVNEFSGSLEDFVDTSDPENVEISQSDVEKILADSVELEVGGAFKMRGGLALVFHLGNRVDLKIDASVTRVGTIDANQTAVFVGGGLVIAWDDPVPAVLPPEKRLENESCAAVEMRYQQCPSYFGTQREIERLRKAAGEAPATDAPATEPAPASAPPASPSSTPSTAPSTTPAPALVPLS